MHSSSITSSGVGGISTGRRRDRQGRLLKTSRVAAWAELTTPSRASQVYAFAKRMAAEFMQKRNPVGSGPSLKTCPRWPPQRAHFTSVRSMPSETSVFSTTFSFAAGAEKLATRCRDSDFV